MIKRIFLFTILTILPVIAQDITGSGTAADPYVLYNGADIDSIRYYSFSSYFKLGADCDLSAYSNWTPIGQYGTKWLGQLDGNGYTIKHLTMNNPTLGTNIYAGLFGYAGAEFNKKAFRNIKLDSVNISVTTSIQNADNNYIGVLVGRFGGIQTGIGIDSVIITHLNINVNYPTSITNATIKIGGFVAFLEDDVSRISVEGDISVLLNGSSFDDDGRSLGGIIGNQATDPSESNEQMSFTGNITNSGTYPLAVGAFVGRLRGGSIKNSYAIVNSIRDTSYLNNHYYHAGLVGQEDMGTADTLLNCYVLIDTLLTRNSTYDLDGLIQGYNGDTNWKIVSTYADTEYVKFDNVPGTTSTDGDRTLKQRFNGATADSGAARTTAQMKDQANYTGWNFSTVWSMTPGINNGYPYLTWNPPFAVTVTNPDTAGIILNAADTIAITFTGDLDGLYHIYYSIDGKATWTLITDTVTMRSYNWVVPNLFTLAGYIKVTTADSVYFDDNNNPFVILPHSLINILSPIDTTVNINKTSNPINLIIETVQVDSLTLYWGKDTTNLNLLTTIVIDTVNNAFSDTTIYQWTLPLTVSGDNIYVYAVAGVDTFFYTFTKDYYLIGSRLASTSFCTEEISSGLFASKWKTDFSCGWVGTISWRQWLVYLTPDGSGYSKIYTLNTWPDRSEPYPTLGTVGIINGIDTTNLDANTFYSLYGGSGTSSVTYKLRQYYIENDTMKMNDLRNGINGISLFKVYIDPTYPQVTYNMFQVYNVRSDSVLGKYFPIGFDFNSYNDGTFKPLILVGQNTTPYNVFSFEALDTPNDINAADDLARIFLTVNSTRDYFRGIHPKAEKRN